MSQCTAKSKRTGERCRSMKAMANGKCYHHGGATPRGAALPQTTHGGYSKDLPTRLRGRYEQAEAHGDDILNLAGDIALLDTLIGDASRNLSTYESGELWMQLGDAWSMVQAAQRAQDKAALAMAMGKVDGLIRHGVADAFARLEIGKLAGEKRKVVATEIQRRTKAAETITVTEGVMLATALSDAVMRIVHDPPTRAAITAEFARILGG